MDADICNESLISIRRIIGDDRQILLQNNTYTKKFNIEYNRILFMPDDLTRDFKTQAKWKKNTM